MVLMVHEELSWLLMWLGGTRIGSGRVWDRCTGIGWVPSLAVLGNGSMSFVSFW